TYHHLIISSHPRLLLPSTSISFFSTTPPPTNTYTLSLHDALPISPIEPQGNIFTKSLPAFHADITSVGVSAPAIMSMFCCLTKRSEEHTSELQSLRHLVCRLLLEKKKKKQKTTNK